MPWQSIISKWSVTKLSVLLFIFYSLSISRFSTDTSSFKQFSLLCIVIHLIFYWFRGIKKKPFHSLNSQQVMMRTEIDEFILKHFHAWKIDVNVFPTINCIWLWNMYEHAVKIPQFSKRCSAIPMNSILINRKKRILFTLLVSSLDFYGEIKKHIT